MDKEKTVSIRWTIDLPMRFPKDWDEVKIDTLVKVKTRSTDTGVLRYFAGVDEFGYPRVFADGATSKTAPKNFDGTSVTEIVSDEYSTIWKEIELYKEDEELPFN